MNKKKRKYNPNKIKTGYSYKIQEIAGIYEIHPRTVQAWVNQGLKVIDESKRPYLIGGGEVRKFLQVKARNRKIKLNEGEFYCTKCHAARRSSGNLIRVEYTEKKLGKESIMVFIKGNCENCGTVLTKFSSDRKVREMLKTNIIFMEQGKGLIGNDCNALNTDIENGKKSERFKYLELVSKTV